MQKISLMTLAGAAALAAGAAHADSTVTLYGLIDVNVTRYMAGSKSGADDNWMVNDGVVNGLNGSRWGIKTIEDLGGGLKANVVAEAGLNADTGTLGQGGLAFGRQVYVGLSDAKLGEIRVGRQYILEDSVMWQSDPFGNALSLNPGTAVTNKGKSLPFWLNAPRANNIVQYRTPDFSGFSMQFQIAPGEGTADRFHGIGGVYQAGAVYAGVSYEWNKPRNGGDDKSNESLTIAANYNFGPVKLLGGVQRNRNLTTTSGNGAFTGTNLTVATDTSFVAHDTDNYTVGFEAPVGNWTFGGNYSNVKYKNDGGSVSATLGKAGLGVRYGFSKMTFLYASASMSTGDLKDYISQERTVQLGLRKAF
ncbi:porin [Ideonella azotifigens]|uniref:Porin n=1 Tax=Ideonella azotifigens TaxID=513160 RepID=A0ABN1KH18_9BURK|nr:porin [Ideonella azotifigens]MCD2340380.1 porin [Ideonella azotifigens]